MHLPWDIKLIKCLNYKDKKIQKEINKEKEKENKMRKKRETY